MESLFIVLVDELLPGILTAATIGVTRRIRHSSLPFAGSHCTVTLKLPVRVIPKEVAVTFTV